MLHLHQNLWISANLDFGNFIRILCKFTKLIAKPTGMSSESDAMAYLLQRSSIQRPRLRLVFTFLCSVLFSVLLADASAVAVAVPVMAVTVSVSVMPNNINMLMILAWVRA